MPKLSWVAGPKWTDDGRRDPPAAPDFLVMASRLELRSYRDFVPFLRASLAIRRQCKATAGNVGHALAVDIGPNRFWTLSSWRSRADLDEFVRQQPHLDVMQRFKPALRTAVFAFFPATTGQRPASWAHVEDILAAEERGRTEQSS